jgi:DNA polymerase/3'-5' exonuclease PolX
MEIVSINPKAEKEEKEKEQLLEVIDGVRKMIENGEIKEFVICSLDVNNECQIHICSNDLVGAVGMFEIGKTILITQEA